MISFNCLVIVFLIHYLADFVAQTDWQAKNKSTNIEALTYHVGSYSSIWLAAIYGYTGSFAVAFLFAIITFICHWLTDYVTSKIVKKQFEAGNTHNGFMVIGVDQMLHYFQLILTMIFTLSSINE